MIIDEILQVACKNDNSVCNAYFIEGPSGIGKTFVYQCLIYCCLREGFEVISVAWAGIVAMLLPLGRTAHSAFKFSLNLHEQSVSNIRVNSYQWRVIRNARVVIWDEGPMAPKDALICTDQLFKDVMGNEMLFGGIIVVMGGCFKQVLPVVPHGHVPLLYRTLLSFLICDLFSKFLN